MENLSFNIKENNCEKDIFVTSLDWRTIFNKFLKKNSFSIILGSDIVYDKYHAEVIPKVFIYKIRNFLLIFK